MVVASVRFADALSAYCVDYDDVPGLFWIGDLVRRRVAVVEIEVPEWVFERAAEMLETRGLWWLREDGLG